jgi:anti-sigma factor RsiW
MWKVTDRSCHRIARWLSEYVDGTLPLARRRAVEAHLRACAGCRYELEALRRTVSLLADLPKRELTEGFDAALRARLETVKADRRQAGLRRRLYNLLPVPGMPVSPLRRLAPAGAMTAAVLSVVAWQMLPGAAIRTEEPRPTPAYVQALVKEHQGLRVVSDLNATVVSHNLAADTLGEGDE